MLFRHTASLELHRSRDRFGRPSHDRPLGSARVNDGRCIAPLKPMVGVDGPSVAACLGNDEPNVTAVLSPRRTKTNKSLRTQTTGTRNYTVPTPRQIPNPSFHWAGRILRFEEWPRPS
ncbi:hypothetical protein KC361_g47 [Hortaea werneckii]|nr:hypothetical protein KC361_g47 [Hortaea werneckii]